MTAHPPESGGKTGNGSRRADSMHRQIPSGKNTHSHLRLARPSALEYRHSAAAFLIQR
jgi:hypothetical protein